MSNRHRASDDEHELAREEAGRLRVGVGATIGMLSTLSNSSHPDVLLGVVAMARIELGAALAHPAPGGEGPGTD